MSRTGTTEDRQHAIDTLKFLLKIGKLDERAVLEVEEANIIEMTGWTPETLAKQDSGKMEILKTIWAAKGSEPKRMTRGLK
ncbi:Uncharacterised protein [Candidatus Anstonella stagnisolia]|nr:Uncharacterised protein [Candidatus Anstonella stagnisolia]